jgi:hypothetical protein
LTRSHLCGLMQDYIKSFRSIDVYFKNAHLIEFLYVLELYCKMFTSNYVCLIKVFMNMFLWKNGNVLPYFFLSTIDYNYFNLNCWFAWIIKPNLNWNRKGYMVIWFWLINNGMESYWRLGNLGLNKYTLSCLMLITSYSMWNLIIDSLDVWTNVGQLLKFS